MLTPFSLVLPIAFLAVITLAPVVVSSPSQQVISSRSVTECGFDGDNDSYGLGVRLGAYLQWLTSIFAYHLSATEAKSMRAVNTCFQIAVICGLIANTRSRGGGLHAIEGFIILLFCLGGMCPAVTWPWQSQKKAKHPFGKLSPANTGTLIRLLALLATCSYGVWYSFQGMDTMQHDGCTTWVFCFAKVNLYGGFRIFLKCLFSSSLAVAAVVTVDALATILFELYDFIKNWMYPDEDSSEEIDKPRPSWKVVLPSVLALVFLAVTVELTLLWSHVDGIYNCNTTGQLFPLIVGAAGALRLVYILLIDFLRGNLRF